MDKDREHKIRKLRRLTVHENGAAPNRPRTASNTLEKLSRLYGRWFKEPLTAITVDRIESMKIRRIIAGRVATTVLRDIFTLSRVLSRAVKLGKLTENPVR